MYGSCRTTWTLFMCSLSFQEPHSIPLAFVSLLISLSHSLSHHFIHPLLFFQYHVSLPDPSVSTHTQNTLSFPPALISGPSWNQTLQINNVSVQHSKALSPTTQTLKHCILAWTWHWKHTESQVILLLLQKMNLFRAAVYEFQSVM